MKKIIAITSVILSLMLIAASMPAFSGASYIIIDNFKLSHNSDGTLEVAGYEDETAEEIVIPSALYGNSITSIAKYAFTGNKTLTSVTLPSSLVKIGDNAFSGCTAIESLVIPDSVKSIGSNAFYECSSISQLTIGSSVTEIPDYAFNKCSSLTEVVIPDSVASIGQYAFYDCKELKKVEISASTMLIESMAFYSCPVLTDVVIKCSNMNMVIEDQAFDDLYFKDMTITGAPDSPAEKYANDNEIEFVSDGTVFVPGDTNTDKLIDGEDVSNLLKYIVDIIGDEDIRTKYADANGDGSINVKDVTFVQKKIVGIIQ